MCVSVRLRVFECMSAELTMSLEQLEVGECCQLDEPFVSVSPSTKSYSLLFKCVGEYTM